MWLINKSYKSIDELTIEAPNANGVATIYRQGYYKVDMPMYETYEHAVGDFPHETIIQVKT